MGLRPTSRRHFWSLAAVLVWVAGYFAVHIASGDVLYPNGNQPEVGQGPSAMDVHDLWHADTSFLYVPETAAHLGGDHGGWLSTWTPHNGLGRPLFQFGPAPTFVVSHVFARLTRDPFVHHTWMTIFAVIATALFAWLFFDAIGIGAVGAFVGALGISLGPLYSTWDMIPLIQWGYCWTFAALFAVERWIARGSLWSVAGLTFCFHAILLSGFLQHMIALAWIAGGWTLLSIFDRRAVDGAPRGRAMILVGLAVATLLALVSVAPVYLDLYTEWERSTRAAHPQTFDPNRSGIEIWPLLFCVIDAGAPGHVGASLGVVPFCLACVGLLLARRIRAIYWGFAAALFSVGNESSTVYELMVKCGFAVSDWPPLFAAHLPFAVLVAGGADVVAASARSSARASARLVAAVVILCALGTGYFGLALHRGASAVPLSAPLAFLSVVSGIGLVACVLVPMRRWRSAMLMILAAITSIVTAKQVVAWQPRTSIATTSPLAQTLAERTGDGSRWLWVGPYPPGRSWIRPNVDAVLGTRGLASYDHLPSRAFHEWLEPMRSAADRVPYKRSFLRAESADRLEHDQLAFAAVNTLVTLKDQSDAMRALGAEKVLTTPEGPIIWVSGSESAAQALVPFEDAIEDEDGNFDLSASALRSARSEITVDRSLDDEIVLEFDALEGPALLFVSQEHHVHWKARSEDRALRTVKINGLFQGVVVPAGTECIELEFCPLAPWMLLPQLVFVVLGLVACALLLPRPWRRVRP